MKRLTENIIKCAFVRNSKYYLSDGNGLLLEVNPNGSKYWILRLYMNKKEVRRSLGVYPSISLKDARRKAFELKESTSLTLGCSMTLEQAYQMYYEFYFSNLSPEHQATIRSRWENYIKPQLGSAQLGRITPNHIVTLCQKIIKEGHFETAKRMRTIIFQIFNFAAAQNIINNNPTSNLSAIFPTRSRKHFSCLTEPEDISVLMRNIDAYPHLIVRLALQFSAMTFCRPGEIRHAEWKEIDLSSRTWTIKETKMKMKRDHIVPLSEQNIKLLNELFELTGRSMWLFPSARSQSRPISEGTLRVALRSMGFTNDQMTPHGFRAMASTILNTYGWPKDYIELQLSHVDSSVRAVYNRSLYLSQRRLMMQWWSDYLDSRRENAPVPPKPEITIF